MPSALESTALSLALVLAWAAAIMSSSPQEQLSVSLYVADVLVPTIIRLGPLSTDPETLVDQDSAANP